MLSRAHLLYAMISLGRGNVSNALRYARESAQLPYSELSRIDSRLRERLSKGDSNGGPGGRPSPSDAAGGAGASDEQYKTEGCDSSTILGPHAWLLARAAFRSLCQLSAIYAHLGVFSETLYYAEQAQVIATTMAAPLLLAQANSWLSTVWLRASMNLKSLHAGPNLEKARELAASVRPALASDDGDGSGHLEQTYLTAQLACRMSRVFLELEDYAAAENLVSVAESTLEAIISGRDQGRGRTLHVEDSEVNVKAVEVKMQRLRLTGKATATTEADVKTADVKMQRLRTKGKATTTTRANVETAEVKMPELRLNGRATKTKAASRAATKPTRRTAPARTSGTASATEVEQTLPAKTRAPRLDSKPALLLRSAIEIQKARIQVKRKEWACAAAVFEKAGGTLGPSIDLDGHVTAALSLVGQAMELVTQDPVFSVLQDSTLSFPAITSHGKMEGSSMSTSVKRSPQKGSRSVPVLDDASSSDVFSLLCRAQTHLLEAQSVANVTGDSRSVQKICGLLQNTVILLSAAKDRLPEGATTYGHATYSTEMARNVTWRRERKAALADRSLKSEDAGQWPAPLPTPENRRASFGTATDLAHFQHDYVDIVPASWTVVSLSLSDDRRDLCIARLRPHAVPFVVRLPFERASLNSQHDSAGGDQDDDDGHFSFARGRDELLDIVRRSDALCHDKRDFSVRGARSAWWAERTDLDARLGAFLRRVESVWLGGFRGVLSSSTYRFPEGSGQAEELLMRFGNAFTANVLNKFLPSRRVVPSRSRPPHAATKGSKPAAATTSGPANRVALDASVLELFVNLGDPRQSVHGYDDEEETEGGDGDGDLEDLIGDLLYFVVDVLQLNGERNAYDEIDFDAMVIATMDCLAAYHQEAKEAATLRGTGAQQQHGATQAHTILVLDQALQMFPWEALPCLKDTAVSRVPSLACLRRLVLAQQQQKHQLNVIPSTAAEDGTTTAPNSTINLDKTAGRGPLSPFGHHLSPTSGTLILNPGGDLVNTQKTFEKPLCSTLSPQTTTGKQHAGEGWTHIVARAPSEAEFAAAAAEKDVLLYIGHGSGAQYIRDKTIRRLASASSSMSSTAADDKASTEDTVSAANSTAGCRATVLLFGCTSGALVEHGDFEVSGPARSYMLAGAPCVLGTLWEVTDRDIDRFASSMLEDWGLVPRGTLTSAWTSGNTAAAAEGRSNGVVAKARGKAGARRGNVGYGSDGEARVSGMVDEPLRSRRAKMSLQQAVVRARDAVRFRYLTAGAVVVYGIPVYVKDN